MFALQRLNELVSAFWAEITEHVSKLWVEGGSERERERERKRGTEGEREGGRTSGGGRRKMKTRNRGIEERGREEGEVSGYQLYF